MLIFGHRGDPTRHPQNTIAGFEGALSEGADGVELDARNTLDHKFVVRHDAGPERLTLRDLQLREPWVPTLSETLAALHGRCLINIELKTATRVKNLATEVLEHCSPEEIVFTSFLESALSDAAAAAPEIRRGLLVGAHFAPPLPHIRPWRKLERTKANLLVVEHRFLDKLAEPAIKRGIDVWSWNWFGELLGSETKVTTSVQINTALAYGLEAVIVDRPLPGPR